MHRRLGLLAAATLIATCLSAPGCKKSSPEQVTQACQSVVKLVSDDHQPPRVELESPPDEAACQRLLEEKKLAELLEDDRTAHCLGVLNTSLPAMTFERCMKELEVSSVQQVAAYEHSFSCEAACRKMTTIIAADLNAHAPGLSHPAPAAESTTPSPRDAAMDSCVDACLASSWLPVSRCLRSIDNASGDAEVDDVLRCLNRQPAAMAD